MGSCRSLAEILTKLSELGYENEKKLVICSVCSALEQHLPQQLIQRKFATFSYENLKTLMVSEGVMSKKFRNLKTHLSSHLKSASHVKEVNRSKIADKEVEKYDKRERSVGKKIGYYLFKIGEPDTDFEPLDTSISQISLILGTLTIQITFLQKFCRLCITKLNIACRNFLPAP